MDIGISTLVDLDLPMDELSRLIAAAGFTYISLSHDIKHAGYHTAEGRQRLRELWDGLGLKLNYIHPPLERYHDLTSLDPQVRRATIEMMKMTYNAAADLGGRSITFHMTNEPEIPEEQFPARCDAGLESLKELLAHADSNGVAICVENLPLTYSFGKLSLDIIRATADWNGIQVCFDGCHTWMQNPDAEELIRELAPRAHTTHLSDTMGEEDSHLIPGEGRVDYAIIARELGKAGFKGVVDMECSLWMLRRRYNEGRTHVDDPVPCSTEHYLERAYAAAVRIAQQIDDAQK